MIHFFSLIGFKIKPKFRYGFILWIVLLSAAPNQANSQVAIDTTSIIAINKDRIKSQKQAMTVLLGWSFGNSTSSAFGLLSNNQERARAFHEMNILWNSVNISIAMLGLISAKKEIPTGNALSTIKSFHQLEQAYLFNSGLDLAYVMSGLYLTELGRNRNSERLIGMGNSIMLQGGFLFVFDLVKYIQTRNKTKGLYKLLQNTGFNGNGFSHTLRF